MMTIADAGIDEGRPAHEAPAPEADLGALLGALGDDALLLLRRDVELARAEMRQTARHATIAGVGFGAAALLGFLAVVLLAVAAGFGLAEVMPAGLAFAIVGLVVSVGAGAAFVIGRKHLAALDPVPHHTIDTMKEDLSWLRARTS